MMDFGLSEVDQEEFADRVGTGSFMAPEVATGKPSKKSDIWAMAETMLRGVFEEWDSVDIMEGRYHEKKTNIEMKRANYGEEKWEREWHEKLARKTRGMRDSRQFRDFINKSMRWKPQDRMTARDALQHKFLKLTRGDETEARRLLKILLP